MFEQLLNLGIVREPEVKGDLLASITPNPFFIDQRYPSCVGISADGTRAMFSYPAPSTPGNFGGIIVFEQDADQKLVQKAYLPLTQFDTASSKISGHGLQASMDPTGTWIACGASAAVQTRPGGLTLHKRTQGTWAHHSTLASPAPVAVGMFGANVLFLDNGQTMLVVAQNENSAYGRIYIYKLVDDTWTYESFFNAPETLTSTFFGYALAASDTGQTLVVSAQGANKAYIFTRSSQYSWSYTGIVSQPAEDVATNSSFSNALDISGDGNTLIIAAPAKQVGTNSNIGVIYLYKRVGGTYVLTDSLRANINGAAAISVGANVTINNLGTYILHTALVSVSGTYVGRVVKLRITDDKFVFEWSRDYIKGNNTRNLQCAEQSVYWVAGDVNNGKFHYGN